MGRKKYLATSIATENLRKPAFGGFFDVGRKAFAGELHRSYDIVETDLVSTNRRDVSGIKISRACPKGTNAISFNTRDDDISIHRVTGKTQEMFHCALRSILDLIHR